MGCVGPKLFVSCRDARPSRSTTIMAETPAIFSSRSNPSGPSTLSAVAQPSAVETVRRDDGHAAATFNRPAGARVDDVGIAFPLDDKMLPCHRRRGDAGVRECEILRRLVVGI